MNPIENDDGEIEYFISIGKDVTERKEKNNELAKARKKAERIAREKQSLVSVLSHDVKSPLNSILGSIDLLLRDGPRDDQSRLLDILQKSARNMQRLVENMLQLAKVESREFKLNKEETDLAELINEIISPLLIQAKKAGNALNLNFDESLSGKYKLDTLRFSQLLTNLITNAIKFTQNGSIDVKVKELESTEDSSQIQVEVQDDGRGIEPAMKEKIFKKFEQGNASNGEYGGSGLGLTICRYIVKKMNGKIWVKSELGKGATFYIKLTFAKV